MSNERIAVHEPPNVSETREIQPSLPFAFRLRGILPVPEAFSQDEHARISQRLVNSISAALPPGERAVFHHRRILAGEIEWTLEGQDSSPDLRLMNTLESTLEASGGLFRFERTKPERFESLPYRVRIRPFSRTIPRPSQSILGFGVANPSTSRWPGLRLPMADRFRTPVFSSVGELLQSAHCDVVASVGIRRLALTSEQSAMLADAERALRLSTAASDHAFADWLAQWIQMQHGWNLDCEVVSSEPLAEPFLQLIGVEVFGQQVEIVRSGAIIHADDEILDLSVCRLEQCELPRLFPGGVLLASLRQPRSFNRALPHLPLNGTLIGEVECQGVQNPFFLPDETRDRHCWLIGATGTGKSSLLLRMIVQSVEAGEGVALIDPHGDLFEQVLDSIPPERIDDVVLLEPGRGSRVPGLNFLEVTNGPLRELQRNFVINELLGIFGQLWDMQLCGGPMFQVYFRNALLLLMGGGADVTLAELPLVFEDRTYRDRLKAACQDTIVTGFWNNQAEKAGGDASLNNIAPYITSKLNIFTHSSVLRPIIGQAHSTLDFRDMLSKRRIFLVNLSKGLIGEAEARLLGMLLLGRIFAAGMERAIMPPHRRIPFSLFIDETQNFLTPTLASMLAEARKFGLRLTLANQNLGQLAGSGRDYLLQSLLGNVGSLAMFRLGPVDAQSMAVYTKPAFDALTLERLPNFHAVGRILTRDGPLDPLVFQTLPPVSPTVSGTASTVRRRQRRFTRPIAKVEAEIRARRERQPVQKSHDNKIPTISPESRN